MDIVNNVTKHVAGISVERGGSGNPSPVTAYGVFMGMKAAAKYKFGTDNLEGKSTSSRDWSCWQNLWLSI